VSISANRGPGCSATLSVESNRTVMSRGVADMSGRDPVPGAPPRTSAAPNGSLAPALSFTCNLRQRGTPQWRPE